MAENEELGNFLGELTDADGVRPEEVAELQDMAAGRKAVDLPEKARSGASAAKKEGDGEEVADLRALIADMSVPQKLKLAMFGNGTCRMLLVQDSSRLVQTAVLKNPQLQENEIESFSKNPNVSDFVLRTISRNRNWVKNYSVKMSLVFNPKTPTDVSLKWLRYLNKSDLRRLAKSKNVPQVLAVNARKRLAESEKR